MNDIAGLPPLPMAEAATEHPSESTDKHAAGEATSAHPADISTTEGAVPGDKVSFESLASSSTKHGDASSVSNVEGFELVSESELPNKLRDSTPQYIPPLVSPRDVGPTSTLDLIHNSISRDQEFSKPGIRSYR
jgi:hypothetical protein